MAMDWEKLLTPKRFGKDVPADINDGRSNFHRDYDRIIFSSAFRRLQGKTQVHPSPKNDHIHTRLTHSLEVGCVGRSLGAMAGIALKKNGLLPSDFDPQDIGAIVQAACLAHDIGNPPFGHAGEEAIRQWFSSVDPNYMLGIEEGKLEDFKIFEGNAQGFRVITNLEYNLNNGGMRLSYPTLGAFQKYPWTSSSIPKGKEGKFGCFKSELKQLREVAETLGLIEHPKVKDRWCRHPLAYLVEAADDICYRLIDIEDAIELGLIRLSELEDILKPVYGNKLPKDYDSIPKTSPRRKISLLRGKAMEPIINNVVKVFMEKQNGILEGKFKGDLIDNCDHDIKAAIQKTKKLAVEEVFTETRKVQAEIGVYSTMDVLLTTFFEAAKEFVEKAPEGKKLSFKTQRIVDFMKEHGAQPTLDKYEIYMGINDYVSGMTDDYASFISAQILGLRR